MFWQEAISFCQGFGMQFATIETADEQTYFFEMMKQNIALLEANGPHIGALTTVSKSTTDWYWVETGNNVSFKLNFLPNEPSGGIEYCLGVRQPSAGQIGFNDTPCFSLQAAVLCQTLNYRN